MGKGYEFIHIRCSPETKKKWREVLYEFKKYGYSADDLLRLMIECLRTHYVGDSLV